MSTTPMADATEDFKDAEDDGGFDIKTLVEFARYYDELSDLDGEWKFKHADISRSTFHSLRNNDLIVESDRSMGKTATWEYSETTERLMARVTPIMAREIDSMTTHEVRILSNNATLIRDALPSDEEEMFEASEVGMGGRTPEGLDRHGFITREEDRDGYPNVWSITSRTKAVQEFLDLYYDN